MVDVFFFEAFKEEEEEIKKFLPSTIQARFSSKPVQEEKHPALPAKLISIRTQSAVPASWAKHIEGILTRSTGYDHLVRYKRRTKSKVICGYLPEYCARAVAEQAILLMMALWRKLATQQEKLIVFNRDGMTGTECAGKNLLVVGVGRIGSQIARLAQGMDMAVKGVDIAPKETNVEYVSLEDGLSWADAIVCALPLTEKTFHLFNEKTFAGARPGCLFINIARGEIAPLEDLKKLLEQNIVGGAGLDVYEDEAKSASALRLKKETKITRLIRELRARNNVIMTPHNAFNTREAVVRKARQSVDAVKSFLEKKTFPHLVPEE